MECPAGYLCSQINPATLQTFVIYWLTGCGIWFLLTRHKSRCIRNVLSNWDVYQTTMYCSPVKLIYQFKQ